MNQFARIISSVFQPLLMPVYSILLLFVYTHFKLLFAHQFCPYLRGVQVKIDFRPVTQDQKRAFYPLFHRVDFLPRHDILLLPDRNAGVVSYARLIFHCCYPHRHIHYHLVEDQRPHVRYRRFAGGGNVGKLLH